MSLTIIATAKDPANFLTMHSRMICEDQRINFFLLWGNFRPIPINNCQFWDHFLSLLSRKESFCIWYFCLVPLRPQQRNVKNTKLWKGIQIQEEKMSKGSLQIKCKYFNPGYCKFKDNCKKMHPKMDCLQTLCLDKSCQNRHPKTCRYTWLSRRRSSCMYMHNKY